MEDDKEDVSTAITNYKHVVALETLDSLDKDLRDFKDDVLSLCGMFI